MQQSNPFREIRVFISSRCTERYQDIRLELFERINSSGIFEAYIFERSGASTRTAKEAYISQLRDSDVCVFIIGASDGLSEGVLEEIDAAHKYKKRSMFYLCGFGHSVPNELRPYLSGGNSSLYQNDITNLQDIPQAVIQDLQRDVLDTYRAYCQPVFVEEDSPASTNLLNTGVQGVYSFLPKSVLRGSSLCASTLESFILGSPQESSASTNLDSFYNNLLDRIIHTGLVDSFDYNAFVNEAKGAVIGYYNQDLIKLRWKAIASYRKDDIEAALEFERQAYAIGREDEAPGWLIDDMLIDLRNIETRISLLNHTYQDELNASTTILSYPALDRIELDLTASIRKQEEKRRIQSVHTTTYGNPINEQITYLAQALIIPATYGSLTHLNLYISRLESFALHLCESYGSAEFGSLYLKLVLCSGDGKKIERCLQSMDDIDNLDTSADALEALYFVRNCALPEVRMAATLEAFCHLGPYMSDKDFAEHRIDFMAMVQSALRDHGLNTNAVHGAFNAMRSNSIRLDPTWIAAQCIAALTSSSLEAAQDALKLVSNGVLELAQMDSRLYEKLINGMGACADRYGDIVKQSVAFSLSIIASQNPNAASLCERTADEHLSDRHKRLFQVENANNVDSENVITNEVARYIDAIDKSNADMGRNGAYWASGLNEFDNTANLLEALDMVPSNLIERAMDSATETLRRKNQTLANKSHACMLLMRLLPLANRTEIDNASDHILSSLRDEHISASTEGIPLMGEKSSFLAYSICFEATKVAAGASDYSKLESMLAQTLNNRIYEQTVAAKALRLLLRSVDISAINDNLLGFLHAYAAALYSSSYFEVRTRALELLLELLKMKEVGDCVADLIVTSFEQKSPNEKCRIIRNAATIKAMNPIAWASLKRKSLGDPCSIPRELAKEFFLQDAAKEDPPAQTH